MKIYLKGFGKGLLIGIGIIVILSITTLLFEGQRVDALIAWIFSCFLVWRGIQKYKLNKGWLLLTFVLGGFTLPFYYGALEQKISKK